MKSDLSFESISCDILKNKKFKSLSLEVHHGMSRLDHIMKVSKYVYIISKKLNFDYVSATRAALLHDFFTSEDMGNASTYTRYITHPKVASANARREFDLNDIEINSIESHMFPANFTLPKYKECWVLSIVDKGISLVELFKYDYKYRCAELKNFLKAKVQLASIVLFYLITMSHN